jgi:hypothetical protein
MTSGNKTSLALSHAAPPQLKRAHWLYAAWFNRRAYLIRHCFYLTINQLLKIGRVVF